jgi:GxxExxY protein
MELNDLTYNIRKAIYAVHNELGYGFLESVYEAAMIFELKSLGLFVASQVELPVRYKNKELDHGFRIDLLVEIKSVETIHDIHKKILLNYLRMARKHLGILVNFNVTTLVDKESLIRIIN